MSSSDRENCNPTPIWQDFHKQIDGILSTMNSIFEFSDTFGACKMSTIYEHYLTDVHDDDFDELFDDKHLKDSEFKKMIKNLNIMWNGWIIGRMKSASTKLLKRRTITTIDDNTMTPMEPIIAGPSRENQQETYNKNNANRDTTNRYNIYGTLNPSQILPPSPPPLCDEDLWSFELACEYTRRHNPLEESELELELIENYCHQELQKDNKLGDTQFGAENHDHTYYKSLPPYFEGLPTPSPTNTDKSSFTVFKSDTGYDTESSGMLKSENEEVTDDDDDDDEIVELCDEQYIKNMKALYSVPSNSLNRLCTRSQKRGIKVLLPVRNTEQGTTQRAVPELNGNEEETENTIRVRRQYKKKRNYSDDEETAERRIYNANKRQRRAQRIVEAEEQADYKKRNVSAAEEAKRKAHNSKERERRADLKDAFALMRWCLGVQPEDPKVTARNTLVMGCRLVKNLERESEAKLLEKTKLEIRQKELLKKLKQIKRTERLANKTLAKKVVKKKLKNNRINYF